MYIDTYMTEFAIEKEINRLRLIYGALELLAKARGDPAILVCAF